MANEVIIKQYCPNCSGLATRDGNEITCENCDATFTIKRTGAAKVKTLGRLENLEAQVLELQERIAPRLVPSKPRPAEPEEPEESIL